MIDGIHKYTIVLGRVEILKWASRAEKLPIYEKWDNFVNEQMKNAPPTMKNAFQSAGMWSAMPTEEAYVHSAI